MRRGRAAIAAGGLLAFLAAPAPTLAADVPPACPAHPGRVVRSAGGVVEYLGTVAGISELCRMRRSDGEGDFYLGLWRSDWPGAGDAYPALRIAMHGPEGTRTAFITRALPGAQWEDSFVNQGVQTITVGGHTYRALVIAHERKGIEGNRYHSIITQWKDLSTGMTIKTAMQHFSGQPYAPETNWVATQVERLP